MKLRYYGFTKAAVEKRAMTIAELKLAIITGYVEHGEREVVLMDLTYGDTATFKNIEDVTKNEWSGSLKIEIINLPRSYKDETNKTIIVFQVAEELDDMLIT